MRSSCPPEPVRPATLRGRLALVFSLCLALFAAARAALFLCYPESFAILGATDITLAFLHGVRFDASIALTFLGAPVALLALPLPFCRSSVWQRTWGWIAFAQLSAFALALASDLIYFGHVGRHVGPEAAFIGTDIGMLLGIAVREYSAGLLTWAAGSAVTAWLWHRQLRRPLGALRHPAWVCWVAFLILAGVSVSLIRGTTGERRLHVVDGFASGPVERGYLTLNGVFSLVHSLRRSDPSEMQFLAAKDATRVARETVATAEELFVDPAYPMLRRHASNRARDGDPPNVIIVVLESWDARVVDRVRQDQGLEPRGLTPRFAALARTGTLYQRCYAVAQRSMDAFAAILAGFPPLPGMPYLGTGMEQSRLSFLGRLARAQGYSTVMVQGSERTMMRMDAVAALAGFETFLGEQDVVAMTGHAPMPAWGAWDHDTFAAATQILAETPRPFLGLVFTASTHSPFQWPERFAPAVSGLDRFETSVQYADEALGQFLDSAATAGVLANTILVVTADHVAKSGSMAGDPLAAHHVPLLLAGPMAQAGSESHAICSQLDLLPTLIDLLDWPVEHATFGRSLLAPLTPAQPRGALLARGRLFGRVEEAGWLLHDGDRRVTISPGASDATIDAIEQRLLATVQVATGSLLHNRVARPP